MDNLLQLLNNIGAGSFIGYMIGGFSLLMLLFKNGLNFKKWYDKKVHDDVNDEMEETEYHKIILDLNDTISNVNKSIEELNLNQQKQTVETNTKLDDVWNAIKESQRESKESIKSLETHLKSCDESINDINRRIGALEKKTNLLLDSDKEGIKSFIIDKYFKAVEDKYISIHTLERVEKRYDKYLKENGNTYVGKLMASLRKMPNEPQSDSSTGFVDIGGGLINDKYIKIQKED